MASELPPFSALLLAPFSHCGNAATRHFPEPLATPETRFPGIQAPVDRVAMVPLPRPLYHSSLQELMGANRCSSMSFCQVSANLVDPSSEKFTATLVPSTW